MRKLINLVALAALLFVPSLANAQNSLTICDGTATHNFVPFYGYYADATQNGQMIYPADLLTDMVGMEISGMEFYISEWGSYGSDIGNWIVSLGTTTETTLSGINTAVSLTEVYSGAMTFNSDNTLMTVTFTQGFVYTGGNLLVEFNHPVSSGYRQIYFYGVTSSGSSYTYNGQRDFLPKVTFSYGEPPTCIRPENLTATDITSDGLTLNWADPMNTNATYSIDYWKNGSDDTNTVTSSTTSHDFSGLDANSLYYFSVKAICSADDESSALTGSFATACGSSTCEITVTATAQYASWGSAYTPSAIVSQNGVTMATVQGTQQVTVCSTDSVTLIYVEPSSQYGATSVNVVDLGGSTLYEGTTTNNSTGDVLAVIGTPCPSCIPPMALTATATIDEIEFSWTPRSDATQFVVYLNDSMVNDNVTDTFFVFAGLEGNTPYTLRVQSVCTGDDSSSIASINTRTACDAMTIPFFDDFDSYDNGAWPPCWHRLRAYGTDPSVNNQYHHSGSQSMFLLASNDTTLFCTPDAVPLPGNAIQVRYYAFLNWSSYYTETKWIKGGVMTDTSDMSTFIALDSIGYQNFNNVFEEREFNTSALDASETYWVAWMFYSSNNGYGSYNRGAIDDVSITQIAECQRPAAAEAPANITAHTADLAWSAVEGANGYTIYYGTVNDPTSEELETETASDTTFTLTGLSSETTYYAWVATNCGGDVSELRPFNSFTTLISCPAVTDLHVIDSLTTSDGATIAWNAGGDETQWEVVLDSNDAETVQDTFYVASGLESMTGHTVYVRAMCEADDLSAARSISFATACGDATCSFTVEMNDSYGDGWNNGAVNFYQAGVEIGSATLTSGMSTGTATIDVCSSAAVEVRFTAGSYPNEISFVVLDGGSTAVYTATQGSLSASNNGNVLVTVETPCPDCVPPANIGITEITASSATLYWTAQEGQSNWIVRMDGTDYNVTDTFYTFTGLDARTAYTASVATDCGDTSTFISVDFTTDCATGSCDITVDMTDSYGDGWNGGRLDFYQDGTLVGQAGLTGGSSSTATVNVCSNIPVSWSWQTGSYDSEVSYVIYDGAGSELYSSSTDGVNHSDSVENACPTCLRPAGLTLTAIDSTELEFSWVDTLAYEYSLDGSDWQPATSPHHIYNLTPNTSYTFSLRAVCSDADVSNPATLTVRTLCGEMAIPYAETFDSYAQYDNPQCWTVVTGNGYGSYPAVSNSGYNGSAHGYTLAANYGDSVTVATSLVPLPGNEIHVSFWASINPNNTLLAGVMTDLAIDSTFIPVLTLANNNSTYTRYEFSTSALSSTEQYYVAFRMISNNNYYVDIDDVEVTQEQGCSYPANLTATPGAHDIDLTWTNAASMSDFVVEYRPANSNTWIEDGSTLDTFYTITGLNAATNYQVRVGLICNNDTLWTSTNVATTCDLMAVPYFEDFSTTADDDMPPCWDVVGNVAKYDGGAMWHNYNSGNSAYAVVPPLNGNFTKLQITFKAKLGSIAEGDSILIGAADAAGNLLGWLDTLANPEQSRNAFVWFTVYFPNYAHIMPGGAERVVFSHTLYTNNWALIDDITIVELPDCYPVADLTGHNLIDPEASTFTWHAQGSATQWQVYVDTVTVDIDSLANMPASNFTTVTDTSYTIPMGDIQGGGIYNFFVRSDCGMDQSDWVKREFGAGTVIMNNSTTADTVTGCGFVVYDNGGPIAGYIPNSNSALVLRTENAGSQLEIFGGKFGWGSSAATLTVYDGEGTNGAVLYTYNTTDGRDTLLNTVLATSTTGSMTITFSVGGDMCHTGYELYVRCTGDAICPRPTELQAELTDVDVAYVTWTGDAPNYSFYYRMVGDDTWNHQNVATNSLTLNGLTADTVYEMYVVALCTATDSSMASIVRQLNTAYQAICGEPTGVTVGSITENSAIVSWTGHGENAWRISCNGSIINNVTTNPYTLTGLTANTAYTVMVQAVCNAGLESDWSEATDFTTSTPGVTNYTVTVNYNATMGSVTGEGTYAAGTAVTLTASPNSGYRFVGWSNGTTTEVLSFVITSDTAFTATFEAIPTYNVNVNYDATMGTVTGAGTYTEGSQVTLTAEPNNGFHFVSWSNGVTSPSIIFTVTCDTVFTATFEADEVGVNYYDVTVNYDAAMGVVTGGGNHIAENTLITLTATPHSGYRFVAWSNGETNLSFSFILTSDTTFSATFEAIPTYTVTALSNDNSMGSATVTNGSTFQEGATANFTATPNSGYVFDHWSNGATTASISIVVMSDTTLTAYFEAAECPVPTDFAVSEITTHTAKLYWASEASQWEISIAKTTSPNDVRTLTVNEKPYVLTGLESNTSYDVRVRAICTTNTSDWSITKTFTTLQSTDGIDDVEGNGSVTLYPNPASTTVTVDLTGIEGTADVNIIDQSGRTVYTGKGENGRLMVNVSGMAKGAYFVRVTGSNTSAVRKLVVK